MQTVFYDILVKITKLLTPILPHTAEEILDTWAAFMDFRGQVQKALEEARNVKVIGKSLEAQKI